MPLDKELFTKLGGQLSEENSKQSRQFEVEEEKEQTVEENK